VCSFAPSPLFFCLFGPLDLSLRLALIDNDDDQKSSFLREELFWLRKKEKIKKTTASETLYLTFTQTRALFKTEESFFFKGIRI
jgi:hypothetical protein